jgi:hypothetical protein
VPEVYLIEVISTVNALHALNAELDGWMRRATNSYGSFEDFL